MPPFSHNILATLPPPSDPVLIPLQDIDAPSTQAPDLPEMTATGNWNDFSTLEMPRETKYERPPPGCRTRTAKIVGFFLFFGCNGLCIAFIVPLILKSMLGI